MALFGAVLGDGYSIYQGFDRLGRVEKVVGHLASCEACQTEVARGRGEDYNFGSFETAFEEVKGVVDSVGRARAQMDTMRRMGYIIPG